MHAKRWFGLWNRKFVWPHFQNLFKQNSIVDSSVYLAVLSAIKIIVYFWVFLYFRKIPWKTKTRDPSSTIATTITSSPPLHRSYVLVTRRKKHRNGLELGVALISTLSFTSENFVAPPAPLSRWELFLLSESAFGRHDGPYAVSA